MKITMFEIRKNFIKPSILVVLLIFTFINVLKIYDVYKKNYFFTSQSMSDAYWRLYDDEMKGEITSDKISRLMTIYNPLYESCVVTRTFSTEYDPNTYTGYVFGDYRMLDYGFVRPIEYAYLYKADAKLIADRAAENAAYFKSANNGYQYSKNLKIAALFDGRQIENFFQTDMYDNLFRYDFSSMLIILMSILGLVPVFVSERETEMDAILRSSKFGRGKTINGKILASCLYVLILSTWFYAVDFIAFSYFYRLTGLTNHLYAIKEFMLTPINISMGQFILLSAAIKALGLLAIGSVVLFISSFFKNAILPYILSLGSVFSLIFFKGTMIGALRLVNPIGLITNRELFKSVEYVNLFGIPTLQFIISVLGVAAVTSIVILGTKIIMNKNVLFL